MSELTLWYNLQHYQTLIDTPTDDAIYNLFEDCLCMREEIERQQAEIAESDRVLRRIEDELVDVPYKGDYADGVLYLKAEIERLTTALLPLAECYLPPEGYEQHGVTAHFSTDQIIAAKEALKHE